jgi:Protein of unknown function (DUF1439)
MQKIYSSFYLRFLVFTFIFNTLLPIHCFAGSNYFLSGDLINLYLMQSSPIKKSFPLIEFQASNPFLSFSEKGQRLYLDSDVELFLYNQPPIKGKISLDSSFRYDAQSKKISLVDPAIKEISFDILKKDENLIVKQLSPLLAQLFNQQVIYELSTSDLRFLKKTPSAIVIVEGGILFKFN